MSESFSMKQPPPKQNMNRVYNPDTQIPHPPPWPTQRTQFDTIMQQTWCPSCVNKEGFQLSGSPQYINRDTAMTLEDPDNAWSYTASQIYKY